MCWGVHIHDEIGIQKFHEQTWKGCHQFHPLQGGVFFDAKNRDPKKPHGIQAAPTDGIRRVSHQLGRLVILPICDAAGL